MRRLRVEGLRVGGLLSHPRGRIYLRGMVAVLVLGGAATAGWWFGVQTDPRDRVPETKPIALDKNAPSEAPGVAARQVALVADDQRILDEPADSEGEPEPDSEPERLEMEPLARLATVDVTPPPEPTAVLGETAEAAPPETEPEPAPEPEPRPRVAEPPPAEAALAEAERLVAAGDSRAAMDAYRRALVLEPGMAAARVGYARILAGVDRSARAREVLSRGLEQDPGNRVLASHLATLAMEAGERMAAREALERAVQPEAAGEVEAQLAYLHRTAGRHEAARRLYVHLAEAEPDNPRWLTGLGRSAEGAGAVEQAVDAWRRLLEIDRLDPELRRWAQQRLTTLTRD